MTASHSLELTFAAPLDRGPGRPVLMIDGWVEYPYAQTVFAAWQSGSTFDAPTLEARDASGRWHVVAPEFGYPAGMPRRMALPLPTLPRGTVALRLRTTQEIYWDRLAVVYSEPAPDVLVRTASLTSATLRDAGFATRTTGPQRTPSDDYGRRVPLLDTRHPRGWYTRFGPVDALVGAADQAVAVFGPGEEIQLEFEAPTEATRAGWTRRVVLRTSGWCKDMDLYTRDGETVAPLPGADTPAAATAARGVQHTVRRRPMTQVDLPRRSPVGPGTRWLLQAVYACVGLLTATAAYLGGVSAVERLSETSYQGYVYQWAVLAHLAVGVLVIVPFIAFAIAHPIAARAHPNRRAARIGYLLAFLGAVVLCTGVALMRVAGIELRHPAGAGPRLLAARRRSRGRRLGVPATSPAWTSGARAGGLDVGGSHGSRGGTDGPRRHPAEPDARRHSGIRVLRAVLRPHRLGHGHSG